MAEISDDREEFARRLRLQIQARYRDAGVAVDEARFSLHVTASGIDAHLPLAPLFNSCQRDPQASAGLISRFVASVEKQLTPAPQVAPLELAHLVWCVRSEKYLSGLSRREDLLERPLGGDLIAFVAETLPGQVMRGLPRSHWQTRGVDDAAVMASADRATAERFGRIAERISDAPRIPADGWRLSVDQLFSGSIMLIPEVLHALARRAAGPVLLANPDRSVVIAVPAELPSAARFQMRALREWRESVFPSSADVFQTDGVRLEAQPRRRGSIRLMPWLAE